LPGHIHVYSHANLHAVRPVVAKPKTPGEEQDEDEQSVPSDIENGEDPVVDPDAYSESGSDYEEVDEEGDPKPKRSKKTVSEDVATTAKKEKKKGVVEKGKEAVKKAVRKISANAHSHMNFRKLNIKNKNSKAKGRGGRFGGRRR
jgi:DNA replication regulator SLD2